VNAEPAPKLFCTCSQHRHPASGFTGGRPDHSCTIVKARFFDLGQLHVLNLGRCRGTNALNFLPQLLEEAAEASWALLFPWFASCGICGHHFSHGSQHHPAKEIVPQGCLEAASGVQATNHGAFGHHLIGCFSPLRMGQQSHWGSSSPSSSSPPPSQTAGQTHLKKRNIKCTKRSSHGFAIGLATGLIELEPILHSDLFVHQDFTQAKRVVHRHVRPLTHEGCRGVGCIA